MRMTALHALARGLAPILLTAWLAACGGGDDRASLPIGTVRPATLPSCPFVSLPALASERYVSTSGSDSASCGTDTKNACATIQRGIDNCSGTGCGVLVRHGLYGNGGSGNNTPLKLRDGVSVFGGCLFDGEPPQRYRTVLQAAAGASAPTVIADGIASLTSFAGVVVMGANQAGAASLPSIAMAVSNGNGLVLSQATLVGGRGGDGATPGTAATGAAGNGGSAASDRFVAGIGGAACPGGGTNVGGNGASSNSLFTSHQFFYATCRNNNPGGTGPNGHNGGDAGAIKGGPGGPPGNAGCDCQGAPAYDPTNAPTASSGGAGSCGASGGARTLDAWGKLAGTTWSSGQGGGGTAGGGGSGGGGGGGGGYSANGSSNDGDVSGYAGGGGGGGGCGGSGGSGGPQGGASLALLLSAATLINDSSVLVPGPGGRGAQGGQAGQGGPGGPGQNGRAGFDTVQSSCTNKVPGGGGRGGDGGPGGPGAGGAAGNGGPSIGLALTNAAKLPAAFPEVLPPQRSAGGAAGAGGTGGAAACTSPPGAAGDGGGSAFVIDYDKLAGGALAEGQRLGPAESLRSPSGAIELLMQYDGNFCLYQGGNASWCWSAGQGHDGHSALLQTDGNLCLRDSGDATIACIFDGPPPGPGAYLQVRDDGHVAITDGRNDFWHSP